MNELPQYLIDQYKTRAIAELDAGSTIEVNEMFPYVAITLSNGDEYYFQGEEAEELINECPDELWPEDYILAIAQNW